MAKNNEGKAKNEEGKKVKKAKGEDLVVIERDLHGQPGQLQHDN